MGTLFCSPMRPPPCDFPSGTSIRDMEHGLEQVAVVSLSGELNYITRQIEGYNLDAASEAAYEETRQLIASVSQNFGTDE